MQNQCLGIELAGERRINRRLKEVDEWAAPEFGQGVVELLALDQAERNEDTAKSVTGPLLHCKGPLERFWREQAAGDE